MVDLVPAKQSGGTKAYALFAAFTEPWLASTSESIQAEEAAMSHFKHPIDLALLVKLKHEDLAREAERCRLAELAPASPPIWDSASRGLNRLRQLLGGIRAEPPVPVRRDELASELQRIEEGPVR